SLRLSSQRMLWYSAVHEVGRLRLRNQNVPPMDREMSNRPPSSNAPRERDPRNPHLRLTPRAQSFQSTRRSNLTTHAIPFLRPARPSRPLTLQPNQMESQAQLHRSSLPGHSHKR